jgi:hypothetical protein
MDCPDVSSATGNRIIDDKLQRSIQKIKLNGTQFTLQHAVTGQRGSRATPLLFFFPRRYSEGRWITSRPERFTPGKESQYPYCRKLDGPRSGLDLYENSRPPPGFNPWNAQPAASRNADCVITTHQRKAKFTEQTNTICSLVTQ